MVNNFYFFLNDLVNSNVLWLLVPVFFVGVITDKYQEQFKTSVGNAISNGSMIIFTSFTWLQYVLNTNYNNSIIISQIIFIFLMITYAISIISSGFLKNEFAVVYGRIRVVTYFLLFFSFMVYLPTYFFNFKSLLFGILFFPIYYFLITYLIRKFPDANINKNVYKKVKNKLIN
jgi:hypothetical protein